jgi:predicted adenine nucleotide alpha hydrolase (AANH) superfamily ATPase
MNKINYQKELDSLIENLVKENKTPTLLLHSCCAPCSSYVLEYLSRYFKISIFFYNPNIYPLEEYSRRVTEQKGLITSLKVKNQINFIEGRYDTENFYNLSRGLEEEREGGERCFKCYELRLKEAAVIAKEQGYDYFTTTLSISPHKNSQILNQIGKNLSEEYDVKYLYSDFKKKEGYKRSIELSSQYNLYRQDYCGCVFSKKESLNR